MVASICGCFCHWDGTLPLADSVTGDGTLPLAGSVTGTGLSRWLALWLLQDALVLISLLLEQKETSFLHEPIMEVE